MVPDPQRKDWTLMLQPGEVIRADVLRDMGDGRWVLGLLGVEIAFPSLVPLQVGATINLRAEESCEGASYLRILDEAPSSCSRKKETQKRPSKKGGVDFRV